MGDTDRNGAAPIHLTIDPSSNQHSRSRSFFLVDSKTYQPQFSENQVTLVFSGSGGNDYDTLTPEHEKADEGPRHPDHGDTHAWHRFRSNYQDFFSEFFGVFILILFGDGVVAQVVLAGGQKGEFYSIPWCKISLSSYFVQLC
jgi:hypothetical protein